MPARLFTGIWNTLPAGGRPRCAAVIGLQRLKSLMKSRNGSRSARPTDVLISNAWGRSPYNVLRSLARHRLSVVVGTDKFMGMAALSRYSAATFRHPLATTEPEAFTRRIKEAIQLYSPRVYLPMGEDTYVVAKYIDQLQSPAVTIPVAPYQTIRRLHKKDEVTELARSLGIPVPDTIVPRDADDVRNFCKAHGSPVLLKRISSSSAQGVFHLTAADVTSTWNDALRHNGTPLSEFVLQNHVRGTGYGVSMLFNHGCLRATFTHKRLREIPTTGGISTLRIGVVHHVLEEYAKRLLEAVKFHGVAMVEFKHDEDTGHSWLIEVNPRFWGSLALAIRSGVDFPYLLFRMATEGDIEPVSNYRTGVVMKWLLGDIAATIGELTHRRHLRAGQRPKPDAYDDVPTDDPFAFLAGAVLAIRKFLATRTWQHDQANLAIERLDHP